MRVDAYNLKGICFIASEGGAREQSTSITFSKIHNCGDPARANHPQEGTCSCDSSIHDHGVYGQDSLNWVVSDNWIYDNEARGVSMHTNTDGMYVTRNVIDLNGQHGVHFSTDADDDLIENNLITDSGDGYNISYFCGTAGCTFSNNAARENCLIDNNGEPDGTRVNRNEQPNPPSGLIYSNNLVMGENPYINQAERNYGLKPTAPVSCQDNDPLATPGPRIALP
jgi:hypothetical protein